LSLHLFNLHHHEGHELPEPIDVNLANVADIAAESFFTGH
jgi:hypothetical protein